MKILIILGILVIVFTSCGTLISPETQYERERLIAAYDAARQKHNPERVEEAVKDLLVGKWQYVGLEVEKGNVNRAANKLHVVTDDQRTDFLLRRRLLKVLPANRQQSPTCLSNRHHQTRLIQRQKHRPRRRMRPVCRRLR